MGRLLLNSRGLNTSAGCRQIFKKIQKDNLAEKTMFIVSHPSYGIEERIAENCVEIMGFKRENLFFSVNGIPEGVIPDFIHVTEGNTFEILKYMRDNGLVEYIKTVMENEKVIYIGSSAGAAIAGSDVMLICDFDKNDIGLVDYKALELFEGAIIPHYEREYLRNYIRNTEEHIIKRYKRIYSVSNEEVLIM